MYQYGTGYQNPYSGYYNPYSNTGAMQQPNYMQQPVQQQPSQPQQGAAYTFLPLTFVNGIDDVNKFVVPLNQSVYLRDGNTDTLYIKSTNTQGQTSIEQFKLVRSNGETPNQTSIEYVTKQDFVELRNSIKGDIESLLKGGIVNDK